MQIEGWIVEEEIFPGPDLDIRAVYIRLLQQMIDTLKETKTIDMGEGNPVEVMPVYSLPTVFFAYLDTETPTEEEDKALAQIICYRDRRDFLKDLASYGNEEYIKEFGLTGFAGESESEKTA